MRRRFFVLMVCLAALVVAAASPVAANSKPTTGSRIDLFNPPLTFTANAPFYIEHGFTCDTTIEKGKASACMRASTYFELYLDDVLQGSTVDIDNAPPLHVKQNLTNYPGGLAPGTYSFLGIWMQDGTSVNKYQATITFS